MALSWTLPLLSSLALRDVLFFFSLFPQVVPAFGLGDELR